MQNAILGISAYYHDSAAVLLAGNEIVAAAHEERFSRRKHDARFPTHAVRYVLNEGGLDIADLQAVAFYDKPYLKFERLLETYHAYAPRGLQSFLSAMPVWIKEKLFMRRTLWEGLHEAVGRKTDRKPPLLFPEHHLSHAASAFYPSPFADAAILTIDGVGEWSTTTIGEGRGSQIRILRELHFPHSIGLLYSAFTYYCGFRVNSGEYKLMGLAPYGNRSGERYRRYRGIILNDLLKVHDDGSIDLNLDYFEFPAGLRMCDDLRWERLFGVPRREMETEISAAYTDMAAAIQDVTEEIVLRLALTSREITGSKNLVLAGGVALNCVANGKLLAEGLFDGLWIQPAAGDAGGALGAALAAVHLWGGAPREINGGDDRMQGAYLGPRFGRRDVRRLIRKYDADARHYPDFDVLCSITARLLADGHIVGWFQGRMELGPRALGNRSILGDPRHADMQKRLNLKIKFREGFRPFAPSVLAEDAGTYFGLNESSPYMLLTAPVVPELRNPTPANDETRPLFERLYHLRSTIPAVTHVDFSARVQTVHRHTNQRYWKLIRAFKSLTGIGLVVNTSFNVRGEPIVCDPEDAYRCFMSTDMDYLVIGDFLFEKSRQPAWTASPPAYTPD
jgi:carbamoyltransferase